MSHAAAPARLRLGAVWIDALTLDAALDRIERLVDRGQGGAVFTPNVDHVVLASHDPAFMAAYDRADLSLCDGQPLRWASHLLGAPLPERVSGADVFLPLMRLAARRGWRVRLLGSGAGMAEEAGKRLAREQGVAIVGASGPTIGAAPLPDEDALVAQIVAERPELLIVLLGAPKGELFIARARARLGAVVAIQLGATLDFYLGAVRRAPRWMQRAGLEWLYRLLREPRRLAYRYLVRDVRFIPILLGELFSRRSGRVVPRPSPKD